ncbi:glycosyltransferase family 4 protein [Parasphingopyxis lamellibrachiae]|uniref:Glycosyltransferase involved in cell wall biosynthesis n=1 Tax=Parasphingopyxis lamellibrachiae TaxID=680125 RepID=A0A3D9FED2_9SPHN|nr:glycosyltransferase family 4 protein [Parasphingopyxis lamellibrachiae]RED16180.1 glycosyltransferase involved in cell wall biosynthesis [Parasphingopyxis lamellibrachiae]
MTMEKSSNPKAANGDEETPADVVRALLSQLQIYEDTVGELEAAHEEQLRKATRAQGDAVAQSTRAVENQLAYRFGLQLVRAFKNPLRMFVLPYTLAREWIAYRRHRIELKSEPTEPSIGEANSERPQTAFSLDIARNLDVEKLAQLNEKRLLTLTTEATQIGDLRLAVKLAATRWFKTGTDGAAHALRRKRGQLIELAPDWLPPLPKQPSVEADPHKIFHIFKTIYPLDLNGHAVRNRSIATHQKEMGLEPIISVAPTRISDELAIDRATRDGIFTVDNDGVETWFCHFQNMPRKKIPRDTLLTFDTKLLAHICARVNPSIIHAASGFRGFDNALKGIALSKSRGIPFVYEVRSFHEHKWTDFFEGILNAPHTQLRAAQENRCMAEADAIVTISDAMAEDLVGFGVPAGKISIIPNSVDERFLKTASNSVTQEFKERWKLDGHQVIGCISNISKREGHQILCDAFARLHARHSETRLLIVGDGPVRTELEQHVSELRLGGSVIFTGTIDYEEVLAAYSSIDIFVDPRIPDCTSDYVSPMTAIEAMAMRAPVIMSDHPVFRELIGAEERGLFFKTGDSESLHGVMEQILQDPIAASRRAEQARRWVEQQRRWSTNVKLYNDVYAAAREHHEQAACQI